MAEYPGYRRDVRTFNLEGMPNDASYGNTTVERVRAMALPLASAQNYLAGVQLRVSSLSALPHGSEEMIRQIIDGIAHTIEHLQDAGSLLEDNQRETSYEACTLAESETTEDPVGS